MKVRLTENQLRFRLDEAEVRRLTSGKPLEMSIAFESGAALTWQLIPDPEAMHVEASFADGVVTVRIPGRHYEGWDTDDRIGFELKSEKSRGPLGVIVEKDLPCRH